MNKFFFLTIMLLMVAAPNYTTSQNIGQKPRQNDSLIVAAKSEQRVMCDTLSMVEPTIITTIANMAGGVLTGNGWKPK